MDNRDEIEKITLSFLYHKPSLLFDGTYPIKGRDFFKKTHKQIYSAMADIYTTSSDISAEAIKLEIGKIASAQREFLEQNGSNILGEISSVDVDAYSYDNIYSSLKKYSLFQDLKDKGIETTDLYNPHGNEKQIQDMLSKLSKMSYKQIVDHYREKIAEVEDRYENFIEKSGINVSEGLEELVNSFKEQPEIGLPLNGDMFNTMTRGARRKKVYINSASSGSGKSRTAVGNAAKLSIPYFYDDIKEEWVETGLNAPTLIITTELEHSEVQTMVLAYVSGVNEEKILNSSYDTGGERKRVEKALEILKNESQLYIEFIPDPSIDSVSAKIRLYALQKDVEYVFYDYVHVSASTYTNKKDMRDDVWLMLFVDKLKQLANELDIHISTATQVNAASYEDREVKNEAMIRGMRRKCPNTFLPLISGVA